MKRGLLIGILLIPALLVGDQFLPASLSRAQGTAKLIPTSEASSLPAHTAARGLFSNTSSSSAAAVAPFPRVPAVLPIVKQATSRLEDQLLAQDIIKIMVPTGCIPRLKNFYITYGKKLASRGYAGVDTVIVDGDLPVNEKRALFFHEFGHFVDEGCLNGSSRAGVSAYKDGDSTVWNDDPSVQFYAIDWTSENVKSVKANKADFVTGYAGTNVFEDLAESVAYYVVQPDAFRTRAKTNVALQKKLAWIEQYIFPGGKRLAIGDDTGKLIPWDSTKTAYNWQGNTAVATR